MEYFASIDEKLEKLYIKEKAINAKSSDTRYQRELKRNFKRLKIIETTNKSYFFNILHQLNECLSRESDTFEDEFIKYYLTIIIYESSVLTRSIESLEIWISNILANTKKLKEGGDRSFKSRLLETSTEVFKEITSKYPESSDTDKYELCTDIEKILNKAGISYNNLKSFLLYIIDNKSIEMAIRLYFSDQTEFFSQYLRGKSERIFCPDPLGVENNQNIGFTLLKYSSNVTDILFHCTITPKGCNFSDIYCEDGMAFIGPYYDGIMENDIYIEIDRRFKYRMVIIHKNEGYFIQRIPSVYSFMKEIKESLKQKRMFRVYTLLKTHEKAKVRVGAYIKIGDSSELFVRSFDVKQNIINFEHVAGYLKASKIECSIHNSSFGANHGTIPFYGDKSISKNHAVLSIENDEIILTNSADKNFRTGIFYGWTKEPVRLNKFSVISIDSIEDNSLSKFEVTLKLDW